MDCVVVLIIKEGILVMGVEDVGPAQICFPKVDAFIEPNSVFEPHGHPVRSGNCIPSASQLSAG